MYVGPAISGVLHLGLLALALTPARPEPFISPESGPPVAVEIMTLDEYNAAVSRSPNVSSENLLPPQNPTPPEPDFDIAINIPPTRPSLVAPSSDGVTLSAPPDIFIPEVETSSSDSSPVDVDRNAPDLALDSRSLQDKPVARADIVPDDRVRIVTAPEAPKQPRGVLDALDIDTDPDQPPEPEEQAEQTPDPAPSIDVAEAAEPQRNGAPPSDSPLPRSKPRGSLAAESSDEKTPASPVAEAGDGPQQRNTEDDQDRTADLAREALEKLTLAEDAAEAEKRAAELAEEERLAAEDARIAAEDARIEAERELAEQLAAKEETERLAEAERAAEEAERRKAIEEEAKRLVEAELEQQRLAQAEAEAQKKAEEFAAKRAAEEEAKRLVEAELEKQRLAEEEARKKAEEEAKRLAEAELERLRLAQEERKKAEEELAAQRAAEEEARRLAEAEAQRKAEKEVAAQRAAEDEAKRVAEAEAARLAEERRKVEEEAEALRQAQAELEARRQAEIAEQQRLREQAEQRAREEQQRLAEEQAQRAWEAEQRRRADEAEAARQYALRQQQLEQYNSQTQIGQQTDRNLNIGSGAPAPAQAPAGDSFLALLGDAVGSQGAGSAGGSRTFSRNVAAQNNAAPLSPGEQQQLLNQLSRCWRTIGQTTQIVTMRVNLTRDGRVSNATPLNGSGLAVEHALRALQDTSCQPFQLPPQKYGSWQQIDIVFDPRRISIQ